MKFFESRRLFLGCLLLIIFTAFRTTTLLYAEGEATPVASSISQTSSPVATACKNIVRDFIAPRRAGFGTLINEHFRNEGMASDLLPVAMEAYREYRADVFKAVDDFFIVQGGKSLESEAGQRQACLQFAEDELMVIREVLKQHVIQNAHAKKTTRLLDEYKDINTKLTDLNFQMAQMFGYFESFGAKLPCVTAQCQQK